MTDEFYDEEFLLRAVYPEDKMPDFWKDGRLSSAAFKDKHGLSVSRTGDSTLEASVIRVSQSFKGYIVSLTVKQCRDSDAYLKYCPIPDPDKDEYHSEIHDSETVPLLSNKKAKKLSRLAKIEHRPASTDATSHIAPSTSSSCSCGSPSKI